MSASDPAAPRDVLDSEPNMGEDSGQAGDMGVSSERVGRVRRTPEPTTSGNEALDTEEPVDPPPEQAAN